MELNDVGDVMLDISAMRVLGDPERYALLERLRRAGASRLDELAAGSDETVVRGGLSALAEVGLVEGPDGAGRWSAVGRGLYLTVPSDLEGQAAARRVAGIMMLDAEDVPRRWVSEHEPRLEPEWFGAAGRLSVKVALDPDELDDIQAAFERILEPYVNRKPDPEREHRGVRLLCYFLPDADTSRAG